MNSTRESEIEKDLARWPRPRWLAITAVIALTQGAVLWLAPPAISKARLQNVKEPEISLTRLDLPPEWLELQDATLFASADLRGFSGSVWSLQRNREFLPSDLLAPPDFLSFSQRVENHEALADWLPPSHSWIAPEPSTIPAASVPPRPGRPRLLVEGERQMIEAPPLPVQYAMDAVRPTIIRVEVEPDGTVFSATIIQSSGVQGIDRSGINLARQTRFAPSDSTAERGGPLTGATLTFEWYATEPRSQ